MADKHARLARQLLNDAKGEIAAGDSDISSPPASQLHRVGLAMA